MKVFLCGDVMTGRGIDQVLPRPCPPHLYEPSIDSALRYLQLAREELARIGPDARIINLETSITRSETPAPRESTAA
jgi:poly-gamma-glutamate synthesis protein (capsule biosynthesis protein)